MDPGFTGEDGRQLATTPLRMDRAVLQGVLLHEALEVLFQLTGEFGRSTRARAIPQALRPLLRKALHPLAEGGIGQIPPDFVVKCQAIDNIQIISSRIRRQNIVQTSSYHR